MPIVSMIFKLALREPIEFQSFSGFISRSIFYELLKLYDEHYAESLHSSKRLSPFSSWPLFSLTSGNLKFVYKRLSEPVVYARINVLEQRLSDILVKAVASGLTEVKCVNVSLPIIGVSVSWVNFKDLVSRVNPIERFSLSFRTPCYFRATSRAISEVFPSKTRVVKSKGVYRFLPLPIPVLIFRNLVRIWRSFSDESLDYEGFMKWVEYGGIAISGFPKGIKTVRVYEQSNVKKWAVGFIGVVRFHLPEDTYSEKYAVMADTLLRFAEYSNVGGNRTAGFGVVKYMPKGYRSPQQPRIY